MLNQVQGMLRVCIQFDDDHVELGLQDIRKIVELRIRRQLAYLACMET